MTCHDRDFMNRIVTTIIEVANARVTTYSGNYDFYLREREIRREQLLASYRRQQEMLAKEEEFIARFRGPGLPCRPGPVTDQETRKDRAHRTAARAAGGKFEFAEPPRSGDDVVAIKELGKKWPLPDGGEKSVFGGVSGMIRRQEKIAVVGVNGAGKSTFLKVLAGRTEPSSGTVTLGANVEGRLFQPACHGAARRQQNGLSDRAGVSCPRPTSG